MHIFYCFSYTVLYSDTLFINISVLFILFVFSHLNIWLPFRFFEERAFDSKNVTLTFFLFRLGSRNSEHLALLLIQNCHPLWVVRSSFHNPYSCWNQAAACLSVTDHISYHQREWRPFFQDDLTIDTHSSWLYDVNIGILR